VTYQRDGRDMLRDAGRSVHMLQQDAQTIETGLRLAQQKFGSKLALSGPQDFQEKAARIAAEAGLKVEFSDQRLNKIMQERRASSTRRRHAKQRPANWPRTSPNSASRRRPRPRSRQRLQALRRPRNSPRRPSRARNPTPYKPLHRRG
jgi:hypothetical protein